MLVFLLVHSIFISMYGLFCTDFMISGQIIELIIWFGFGFDNNTILSNNST